MAHAIFNVSPVRFLSSFQDNVHTMTNTLKNKISNSNNNNSNNNDTSFYDNKETPVNNNNPISYPVTLQLTLPTEQQAAPIDIPRSIPLNIPNNGNSINSHHSPLYDNTQENFMNFANSYQSPPDDLALCFDSLAVHSPQTYNHLNASPQQINSPIFIGSPQSPPYMNNFGQSPQSPSFLNANHFGHSPHSPSFLNANNFGHSPQSASYLNFGSPQSPSFLNTHLASPPSSSYLNANNFGSPQSQSFLNTQSPQSPSFLNTNHLNVAAGGSPSTSQIAGSPYNQSYTGSPSYNNSFAGSPNSSYFLGSPVITTTVGTDDATLLSPYLSVQQQQQQQVSPVQSPTGSYVGNSGLLFPPTTNFNTTAVDASVQQQQQQQQQQVSPVQSPTGNYIANSGLLFPPATNFTTVDATPEISEETINELLISPYILPVQEGEPKAKRKSTVKKTTPSGRKAKIHKCPYCQHTSNRANNMKEHIQIHDPNRPKPHHCKLCHRPFARKHDMTRHYLSCKKHRLK